MMTPKQLSHSDRLYLHNTITQCETRLREIIEEMAEARIRYMTKHLPNFQEDATTNPTNNRD